MAQWQGQAFSAPYKADRCRDRAYIFQQIVVYCLLGSGDFLISSHVGNHIIDGPFLSAGWSLPIPAGPCPTQYQLPILVLAPCWKMTSQRLQP